MKLNVSSSRDISFLQESKNPVEKSVFLQSEIRPWDLFRSPLGNISYSEGNMRGKGSGQFEQRNQSDPSLGHKDSNKSFRSYKFGESKFYIVNENLSLKFNSRLLLVWKLFIAVWKHPKVGWGDYRLQKMSKFRAMHELYYEEAVQKMWLIKNKIKSVYQVSTQWKTKKSVRIYSKLIRNNCIINF